MNERLMKIVPWIIVAVGAVYLVKAALPPASTGSMNVHEFGKIPVVFQGRVKPYDSLARNSLMVISEKQAFEDQAGRERPAIRWLLDVITHRPEANEHQVFRITNKQLLDTLGLDPRSGFRYSINEWASRENLQTLGQQAQRAQQKDAGQRDAFESAAVNLKNKFMLYRQLAEAHNVPDFNPPDSQEALRRMMQRYQMFERMNPPHAVPPESMEETTRDDWKPLMSARLDQAMKETQSEAEVASSHAIQSLTSILVAYRGGEAQQFNNAVSSYLTWLNDRMPGQLDRTYFETFLNQFSPFYTCAALYVFVFVLVFAGWLVWPNVLHRSAFWLTLLILVVHTFAIIGRMWLQGRPPVTNLYSSAIFIGWGCVALGLLLDWLFRNGIGLVIASVAGFVTLVIAYNLGLGGDTLEMMQAVLDTNFWLATHVTTVTLGYTATFVAGLIGIIYILRGVFTRSLVPDEAKAMGRMLYGVLCFALFLSFTGTVLGGIWADQSWGRFWGWDPKENGALIIVVWNALILHARWGGMVKQRGMATLAIFGNIVTAWSWFGVNMLGAGLHSYGFMQGAAWWLGAFVISQLILIGIGLMPLSMWASFSKPPKLPRDSGAGSGPGTGRGPTVAPAK